MRYFILLISLFVAACGGGGSSGEDTTDTKDLDISWTPPDTREDFTQLLLEEIRGYNIYYGDNLNHYSEVYFVDDGYATGTKITVPINTYYVGITTLDIANRESTTMLELLDD